MSANLPLPPKTQIFHKLISLLEPLKADGTVREIERKADVMAGGEALPLIHLTEGQERQIAADTRGRTYKFPVLLKLLLEDANKAEAKDELVMRIVEILEASSNLQLDGAAVTVDGVEETPFLNELGNAQGGALLLFDVTYRRERGNPRKVY